ncbi:unnamed protein product, partial [marine sediment metagenome]
IWTAIINEDCSIPLSIDENEFFDRKRQFSSKEKIEPIIYLIETQL